MTKQELTESFKGLLMANSPKPAIARLFFKALESGVLDYENEAEDSYRTAKIIYHAILSDMAEHWKPLDDTKRKAAKKVRMYLQKS